MSEEVEWNKILFDRIIGVKLIANRRDKGEYDKTAGGYETEVNEYEINIPAVEHGGLKPDITFSASLLPGEMFHEVTLTIKNYKMPFDIRQYTRMEITAGYRKQNNDGVQFDEVLIRRFPIEIFYSYNLTPAPDSVTVFKGVIVSSFTDNSIEDYFSMNNDYELEFFRDVTVDEYIHFAVQLINTKGYNIAVRDNIPDDVKNFVMNTGPDNNDMYGKTFKFVSVPDILISITNMLEAAYDNIGQKGSFDVHISDGILTIFCTDGFYSEDEVVINLDCISSATLNAGIMNVTAPWYPPLIPGAIIHVERTYIDGSDLPNVIDVDELMGIDNLYRVLTMDVEFSSIGTTNAMKITAIPLRYAETFEVDGGKKEEKEYKHKFEVVKEEAQKIIEQIKENTSSTDTKNIPLTKIEVGEKSEEENPVFKWVLENKSLFNDLKVSSIMKADRLIGDVCIKDIYKSFPTLVVADIRPSSYSVESQLILGDAPIPKYDSQWLWPIVYAATYKMYLDTKKNGTGGEVPDYLNAFALNKKTSGVVLSGKQLAYPYKLKTWNDIKTFKGLYKEAAKLSNLSPSMSKVMNNIGDILNIMP